MRLVLFCSSKYFKSSFFASSRKRSTYYIQTREYFCFPGGSLLEQMICSGTFLAEKQLAKRVIFAQLEWEMMGFAVVFQQLLCFVT